MITVREFTLKKTLSQVDVTIDYKKDFSKKYNRANNSNPCFANSNSDHAKRTGHL